MSEDGVVKVAHVQRVRGRDGRVHLYFRKGAHREGPLVSPDGTQALADEVKAIRERLEKAEAAQARPRPGTIGGMLRLYNRSAEFLALARTTQAGYQDIIDELTADVGDIPLRDVTRNFLIGLRDAWAARGHRAANMRLQVLKNALLPIVDDEEDDRIKGDPFHRIKKVRRPHDAGEAHPGWTDAEVEAAIEDAIARRVPGLARAIALGRYAGYRRGTICKLPLGARTTGPNDQGDLERRLFWITEKRQVLSDKREDPRLTAVLDRTPNRALTVAYNADGQPWREYGLNQALGRHLDRLARAGKVRSALKPDGTVHCPLTVHGLRHARGIELALAGASDAVIMAQLEHKTDRAAKIYRRQADRRRLADTGQDQVDNVVRIQDAKRKKAASPGG